MTETTLSHDSRLQLERTTRIITIAPLLRIYLTIALPIVLTLISVRLIMTPLYLQLEYTRPGFPADPFGLTTEDRLNFAPYALKYLINNEDISYLSDLEFADGSRLFTSRELRHMHDVQYVTQLAFGAGIVNGILVLASVIILWKTPQTRRHLQRGLFNGSLLTLSIIGAIIFVAIISWQTFFNNFHSTFFASGTWIFAYSDTLIRLFPEQFWFDTAIVVGGLTTLTAGLILIFSWRWRLTESQSN